MKRITLAFLLTESILELNAQTIPNFDVKNLVATSPEAAMIGRFGDIPIGYYTGTADLMISRNASINASNTMISYGNLNFLSYPHQ